MSAFPIRGGSSLFAIHAGLVAYLKQNASFIQHVGGKIFDGVAPASTTPFYPHLSVGEMTEVSRNRLTTTAKLVSITLHAYDNYNGTIRLKQISADLDFLLDEKTFLCEGWAINKCTVALTETLTDLDNIRHLVLRVEVLAQPIPR